MQKNQLYGLFAFILGSLMYTLNQTVKLILFANLPSEIIYTIFCYVLIAIGIGEFVFGEFGTQIIVGILSILITLFLLNAILLVWDSFTSLKYTSTDYFVLFEYANNLGTITDQKAILFIAIGPSLGILLWMLLSKDDIPQYYYLAIFAVILFFETWIFAAISSIPLF